MGRNIINPKYQDKENIYIYLDEKFIEDLERKACLGGEIILKDYGHIDIDFNKKVTIERNSSWNSNMKSGVEVEVIAYINHIAYIRFLDEDVDKVFKQKITKNIYELGNLLQ